MALVLKDNTYYVYMNESNKPRKTSDINEAENFKSIDEAVQILKGHPGRLAGFEVYNTATEKICYSRSSRNKRKNYSKNVRKNDLYRCWKEMSALWKEERILLIVLTGYLGIRWNRNMGNLCDGK